MSKSVIIIGGGLSGLASAVFLADRGLSVSIYESSPKLGGRTYSYYDSDKKIFIDNGQHILAGWYENTFEYLKMIGTYDFLKIPEVLELVFSDKSKSNFNFRCGNLPGVYGLLYGIFKFEKYNRTDKLKFLKVKKIINGKRFTEAYLKNNSVETLLNDLEQTENLKKYFWYPLILASFNTVPAFVSAELFVNLIKKGTELKKNMSIILSDANLNELFIDKAVEYLNSRTVDINLSLAVKRINIEKNCIGNIELEDGKRVFADYYISTVPFFMFEKLFAKDKYAQYFCNAGNLKSSTIISVHLFLKEDFIVGCDNKMIGLADAVVQWVFVKNKKHLCLVISGADFIEGNLTEKHNDEILRICFKDLTENMNGFDEKNVIDFKVIKEKRATFLPEIGSENFRIKQDCNIENLLIGGDWTDTGYPATIEGAIKSAKICSDLMLNKINF